MKNIAIALNSGSPQSRNEITGLLKENGFAFWHWIDDFWIVQVPDDYTPRLLHDDIEALPSHKLSTILLFEFFGRVSYWGRADAEAWKWLGHIGDISAQGRRRI